MLFLISVVVALLGAAGVIFGVGSEWWDDKKKTCIRRRERIWLFLPGHLLMWPALIMVGAFGVLWPTQYFLSLANVQSLEAFVETRCAYVQSIEQAESVIIHGAGTVDGSLVDLTYQQQASKYAEMVQELRDKVLWYNTGLQRVDALRAAPLVGGFRVGAAHLEPITDAFGRCP